jgi:TonB family protein
MLDQLERQQVAEEQEYIEQPRLVSRRSLPPAENDQRQRRRMVIALILLLVALGLVLVKDRDFWFPSTPETADSDAATDDQTVATTESAPPTTASVPAATSTAKKQRGKSSSAPKASEVVAEAPVAPPARPAVLPPLRIEVVAGDRNQPVRAGSPSVKVDMQPGNLIPSAAASPTETASSTSVTNAGERVQMSADSRQALAGRAVRPEYPLLARQMKVQGEVPLMASIATDGHVQGLQVLGGPAILADAAQEAVKQWRFKPRFQDGQAVETQIPISVVFTISTK